MMKELFDNTTKAGTAGGTLLTIFGNISSQDILKTVVLAAVGATVSFSVTVMLKSIIKHFKK
jgi:hypothetical protein